MDENVIGVIVGNKKYEKIDLNRENVNNINIEKENMNGLNKMNNIYINNENMIQIGFKKYKNK